MQTVTKIFAIAALTTMCVPHTASAQSVVNPVAESPLVRINALANAQAPADDSDTPKTLPKSKLAPAYELLVETGYSDWQLHGSQNKFTHYATLPSGFFLKSLYYVPKMDNPGEQIFAIAKGIGSADYRGESSFVWNYGATRLSGFFANTSFYENTPAPVGTSENKSSGVILRQLVNRNFSLAYRYRNEMSHNLYQSPTVGQNQSTEYQDMVASGKLGNGFLRLSTANLHFTDNTSTLVNTDVQTLAGSYLWDLSQGIDVEAGYSHASIGQPGKLGSHVETMSLNSNVMIGSGTDLMLAMQTRRVSLPNVQNDYVKRQGIESISLTQHYKTWRGSIAMRLQDDERVNSAQNYVEVPKWSTVEGRISGKVLGDYRLTLRGYTQALIEQPTFNTSDPNNLYWTSRDYTEARLEAVHDDLTYYVVYVYRDDRNASRGSEVQTGQYTAGATYQVSPTLSIFGEYHHETWSGHADLVGYPSIGNYLPDTTTGIAQIIYNPNKRAYVSVTYTGFGTRNDNPLLAPDGNTRGTFVTINGRYRFPKGQELGFMLAPWTYHDNVVSAMNYNATVLMITGSTRF